MMLATKSQGPEAIPSGHACLDVGKPKDAARAAVKQGASSCRVAASAHQSDEGMPSLLQGKPPFLRQVSH